jgi:hypothetical protein
MTQKERKRETVLVRVHNSDLLRQIEEREEFFLLGRSHLRPQLTEHKKPKFLTVAAHGNRERLATSED